MGKQCMPGDLEGGSYAKIWGKNISDGSDCLYIDPEVGTDRCVQGTARRIVRQGVGKEWGG